MNTVATTLDALGNFLSDYPESPLVFMFEGQRIAPGYHVTEVKHAQIESIDCGRGSDAWNEVVIQLLDGSPTSAEGYMMSSKFLGIVGAVGDSLHLHDSAKLFFEFAPGNGPMRKLCVNSMEQAGDHTVVTLGGSVAMCKPFERMRKSGTGSAAGACCGTGSSSSSCCGSSSST